MPNTSWAFGLKPVRHRNGAPYNGATNMYFVPASDATALFVGDPVVKGGTGDADGIMTCTRATAAGGANSITGVVMSVVPVQANNLNYRAASTAQYVNVCDDPDILFEIQEDAVGGALAVASLGLNADLIAGTGSTATGLSGFMLDTSTAATTNTLQLKIERFVPRADNEVSANAKVEVSINTHTNAQPSAGI